MVGGWGQSGRWAEAQSRRDAAKIRRGAAHLAGHGHGPGDDEDAPPVWYRNPWVWVSIVVVALIVAWIVALIV